MTTTQLETLLQDTHAQRYANDHFPSQSITPGVVLLAMIIEALQVQWPDLTQTWTLEQMRFEQMAAPNQQHRLVAQRQGNRIRFQLLATVNHDDLSTKANKAIVSGRILFDVDTSDTPLVTPP